MNELLSAERTRADSKLWMPKWVGQEDPTDAEDALGADAVEISTAVNGPRLTDPHVLAREIADVGVHVEPEIAAYQAEKGGRIGASYAQMYPTRFFFTDQVRGSIVRFQREFPFLTYCNTYLNHPPVYDHIYEHLSVDYWGGGLADGHYVGYRGKDLYSVGNLDPKALFNRIFSDPNPPNIYWIIHAGRMWVRGSGWQGSPWGPAGSDAGHFHHIHVTYL